MCDVCLYIGNGISVFLVYFYDIIYMIQKIKPNLRDIDGRYNT